MTEAQIRKSLQIQGHSEDQIDAELGQIADDRRRDKLDRELEDMGYNLEALERDNPYNQWMYE